jgi:RimJ/RimL family protein N-acetyltransferase
MRLIRIFNEGKILNEELYFKLQNLDMCKVSEFYGCGNEFKQNRDWWVMLYCGEIIAYCGCIYSEGVCLFNRAWVRSDFRGKGIQKKMIKARIKSAKHNSNAIVTYVTNDNPASANSLIACGFRIFTPAYQYAGKDKIYFRKIT